jgi:hypothetical protein
MLHGSRNPPEPTTQLLIRSPVGAQRERLRDCEA